MVAFKTKSVNLACLLPTSFSLQLFLLLYHSHIDLMCGTGANLAHSSRLYTALGWWFQPWHLHMRSWSGSFYVYLELLRTLLVVPFDTIHETWPYQWGVGSPMFAWVRSLWPLSYHTDYLPIAPARLQSQWAPVPGNIFWEGQDVTACILVWLHD